MLVFILIVESGHHFVHATADELLWHVQNCDPFEYFFTLERFFSHKIRAIRLKIHHGMGASIILTMTVSLCGWFYDHVIYGNFGVMIIHTLIM